MNVADVTETYEFLRVNNASRWILFKLINQCVKPEHPRDHVYMIEKLTTDQSLENIYNSIIRLIRDK